MLYIVIFSAVIGSCWLVKKLVAPLRYPVLTGNERFNPLSIVRFDPHFAEIERADTEALRRKKERQQHLEAMREECFLFLNEERCRASALAAKRVAKELGIRNSTQPTHRQYVAALRRLDGFERDAWDAAVELAEHRFGTLMTHNVIRDRFPPL